MKDSNLELFLNNEEKEYEVVKICEKHYYVERDILENFENVSTVSAFTTGLKNGRSEFEIIFSNDIVTVFFGFQNTEDEKNEVIEILNNLKSHKYVDYSEIIKNPEPRFVELLLPLLSVDAINYEILLESHEKEELVQSLMAENDLESLLVVKYGDVMSGLKFRKINKLHLLNTGEGIKEYYDLLKEKERSFSKILSTIAFCNLVLEKHGDIVNLSNSYDLFEKSKVLFEEFEQQMLMKLYDDYYGSSSVCEANGLKSSFDGADGLHEDFTTFKKSIQDLFL